MTKIILEQADIEQLEKMVVEMPFKYAQPLLNFLQSKVVQEKPNDEKNNE